MQCFVFQKVLCELEEAGLCPTRYVSSEEQLVIFLWDVHTGQVNAELQECFQQSGETISK